ncbi:hypothetical protein [Nitratireductor sp. ZSWI3]|uniref:hypothetical protein n=1 Tax=Nitratireductor sp. ZSWI3 TaxID=2966359 RepID=UPI0027E27876|nr:hypothetical protein [Nitratireductor sp. ZSWI3]
MGMVEAWNESAYDDARGILTYENGYRILRTGEVFSASARIRYTPRHVLARLMGEAGLVVDEWLGDWTGAVFHQRSREIIPVGRLAGP